MNLEALARDELMIGHAQQRGQVIVTHQTYVLIWSLQRIATAVRFVERTLRIAVHSIATQPAQVGTYNGGH